MSTVDPPDLAVRPTLRRLFPLWWEQRRLVGLGLACALAFTGALDHDSRADQARDRRRDRRGASTTGCCRYLGLIVAVAIVRFGVNFTRRFATARVGIAVEARLRGLLYDAYLRYPRAFFDRHSTGEVISRATNDIYPVRYFIGWGVVQGDPERDDDHRRCDRPPAREPEARALRRARDAPVAVLTWFFAHRLFPISRLVQAKKGHLDGGDRRGGRRDRDGAGVRPRGRRARRASSAAPRRCGTRRCGRRRSRRTSSPA